MTSESTNVAAAVATENPKGEDSSASEPAVKSPKNVQFLGLDKVTKKTKQATELTTKGLTQATKSTTKGLTQATKSTTKGLTQATKSTTKGLTKVTKKTAKGLNKAKKSTTKHVGTALKQSEDVYEKSVWCSFARFFVQRFPRVFSLSFGVVVPLWLLILISAGFGILLASYEAPQEQASNHGILESRARLNRTFVNRTDLGRLPLQCYLKYLNQTDLTELQEQIIDNIILESDALDYLDAANTTNTTGVNMTDVTDSFTGINAADVINDIDSGIDTLLQEIEEDLKDFMIRCQRKQNTETEAYLEMRDSHGDSAADSLTFNWIRCWPKEINEVWGDTKAVFFPPEDLIEASRPTQQEDAVEIEFVRILNEEESNCLDLGGEEDECFEQALLEASEGARNICHDNVEATSWFFFTIMTTVGYGNQAPVTDEGRLLIYIAGIASLILFAAVLGSSGYIITSIFDDFVSRLPIAKFLQNPLVGVAYWGSIWIGWAYLIALYADTWWAERLPEFDVDVADTLWFAFISTSTIGLGDYFLQPTVMFAGDALKFSVLFLVGFVFLSTFLNKIAEFLFSIVPQRQNSLETRLKESNLIFWKHWPCNDYLRSYMPDAESEETGGSSGEERLQLQQQVQRVESFKSHLPNNSLPPPMNTMNLVGERTMVDLLDEEEMILKVLLESVEQRRTAVHRAGEVSNPALVRTTQLMSGVAPPLLEVESSEQDAMSA